MNPLSLDQPWGRGSAAVHKHHFAGDTPLPDSSWLPRGLGRSYGDVCVNDGGTLLHTFRQDRLIAFDTTTGVIECEAGASLADIAEVALRNGWFLPVTPGTRFVTVGGAIANDVHGKNHQHAGTFGRYVRSLTLRRSDSVSELKPGDALFSATVAGMGLTGLIERVRLQLIRVPGAGIVQQTKLFGRADALASVDEFLALEAASGDWPYTVGWIDTMHHRLRGVFFRGNHCRGDLAWHKPVPTTLALPIDMPGWLLRPWSAKAFNGAYFRAQSMNTAMQSELPLWQFFYPLDAVSAWNRAYGKRGFVQYQFVVPKAAARESVTQILTHLRTSNVASYLGVIKSFGDIRSPGLMSFPMPGVTVTVDIAAPAERELRALDRADAMVADVGGRVYPAKDSRMSSVMFKRFFPQWRELEALRDCNVSSSFWRRVTSDGSGK
ncbi:MAG: FAD-binding oxidoreductase [Betaproteobacteria bacterium]|nr:MAG: FAD-binding oxidoreductase [Betaproteobacteria bacterium]